MTIVVINNTATQVSLNDNLTITITLPENIKKGIYFLEVKFPHKTETRKFLVQ